MYTSRRDWLITARKKAALTQEDLARKIGVNRTSYVRYENGERTPTPEIAEKIERVLSIKKENFFWG